MEQYKAKKVRVWNDARADHKEEFKQEWIHIPAGKYVEMSRSDGVNFMGQYFPISVDGAGNPLKEKRLRLEYVLKPEEIVKVLGVKNNNKLKGFQLNEEENKEEKQ